MMDYNKNLFNDLLLLCKVESMIKQMRWEDLGDSRKIRFHLKKKHLVLIHVNDYLVLMNC